MPPFTQQNREIEIITPLGKDVLFLTDLIIDEELGRMFSFNVGFSSDRDAVFINDLLGQNVSLRMDLSGGGSRFFNGHVSHISQPVGLGDYAQYKATIRPWLWFLTRTADCRIFQHLSVPEIIKQICSEQGYSDIEDQLTSAYRTWEYCVQYRETDFNFISRLMEQEGIYYYFEHVLGKHTLILADGIGSHVPLPDNATILYCAPGNGPLVSEEAITNWHVNVTNMPGTVAYNDYDFTRPSADLHVDTSIPRPHVQSDYEIYDYPGEYLQSGDGSQYTRVRIEELQAQYEQIQGQGIVRGISSGGLFNLTKFPRLEQNREYLIVSVTHRFHSANLQSGNDQGESSYDNHFTVIQSSTPYRTARNTPKPLVQGPQTAVIVGPAGEEIYTNEHGQVKLQFHWDRYGTYDENSSCWIRVSQLWAGKTWGGIHLPRIGQEIIVEHLEGDPDRPIVTGRVYNGEQTPPYALPANKTQSGIKSRSSKGGSGANFNEIRFEDKKGEEQVYIHAEKNQDNIVENDETTEVGRDRTEHVGRDETITIDNHRTEKVGVNETITIGNNRTEKVGVNETITIGSNRTEKVGANETITIAANRTESVGGNETISISGNGSLSIGGSQSESIGKSKTETIALVKALSIGAAYQITVGASKNESVGLTSTEQVGVLKHIIAGKRLELKVGSSSLILNADGTIILSGKEIKISGGKHVEINSKLVDIN